MMKSRLGERCLGCRVLPRDRYTIKKAGYSPADLIVSMQFGHKYLPLKVTIFETSSQKAQWGSYFLRIINSPSVKISMGSSVS